MKKLALLAIAFMLIAAPVLATDMASVNMAPVVAGIAQVLTIDPGFSPVYDLGTGQAVIDPFTGQQKMARTWNNYMYWAGKGKVVQFQSVKLEKILPERKVACGANWPTAPTTVLQQGKDGIMLSWPLLYEVNGVEFRLTVIYNTTERLAYPSPFAPNVASRSHTEVYRWFVVSNTWEAFNARLNYFARTPAGTCESFAVTPLAFAKIGWFINGWGMRGYPGYVPGILDYLSMQPAKPVAAANRFADLEAYIDSVCVDTCAGLYVTGINAGTPSADPSNGGQAILDNPTVPAASLILNDLWAVGKQLQVLGTK